MAFDKRYAVKKTRQFDGKTFRFQDRMAIHRGNQIEIEVAKLKQQGWYVRAVNTRDENGFMVVDIYIRRK